MRDRLMGAVAFKNSYAQPVSKEEFWTFIFNLDNIRRNRNTGISINL
jgi:hypothetical protein